MTTDSHPSDFAEILSLCWQLLGRGCTDRRFGFHHPTVATLGLDGKPKSRVVILREAHAMGKILRFNADIRTRKWAELSAQPAISMTLYDEQEKTQLRIEGAAVLHTENATAKSAWDASQRMSRLAYCAMPGPGHVLASPEDFVLPGPDDDSSIGLANFGTIEVHVQNIEWLYLKVRGNRRVFFDLDANTSQWLVP
jgi:pyridoxamine 5'-phosphate oxidase